MPITELMCFIMLGFKMKIQWELLMAHSDAETLTQMCGHTIKIIACNLLNAVCGTICFMKHVKWILRP